jgi:glycyl-tRNA synthetase
VWLERRQNFFLSLGIKPENLKQHVHDKAELSHYARCCTDFQYQFPFGYKELEGLAHRTDFDLTAHSKHSGKDLNFHDTQSGTTFTPHVIESSVGVGRLMLTVLFDAYAEEMLDNDEPRVVLRLKPSLAPITAAILPLIKKLNEPAEKLFSALKRQGFDVQFDESGSIGKRYRRQDEIGTPVCLTFDFDSLEDGMVTARDRDSLQQTRIAIDQVEHFLINMLKEKP